MWGARWEGVGLAIVVDIFQKKDDIMLPIRLPYRNRAMHHFPLFISLQGFTSSPLFGRLGQRRQQFAFDNLFVLV